MIRRCEWCTGPIPPASRRDARFCRQSCRQASHRFTRGAVARRRATAPLRLAYADPPYPGLAWRYYRNREVDHGELLSRLQRFDGWALSTSARALPDVLALAVAQGLEVRVASWFRGARPTRSAWPLSAWEPVVFAGGRRVPTRESGEDALIYRARPRRTDPGRIIGAKPAAFCYWLFNLLGALPGDELLDVFPGSGGVGRAWRAVESRSAAADASQTPGAAA